MTALDAVSLTVRRASITALVGPDGAGKTSLLRLTAGLLPPDDGELEVLGIDVAANPQAVQERIGYMPQRFGLYEDLSVQENFDLYADMHGVAGSARNERYPQLMQMTDLAPFTHRLAGDLSGGMKQKLGLACTLVRSPQLLLLDEPTVGVDPLSRREFWGIVDKLIAAEQITVLISTAYHDEAEKCDQAVLLYGGKVLDQGNPASISERARGRTFIARPPPGEKASDFQARLFDDPAVLDAVPEAGDVRIVFRQELPDEPSRERQAGLLQTALTRLEPRFEDGFMVAAYGDRARTSVSSAMAVAHRSSSHAAVRVEGLVRRFGRFTAVDGISFDVRAGEIFGLLGPNGAGKTTTFRMLCGLLPATAGTLQVAGEDVRTARASARQRIGYVAQKFSLYGTLTVIENLEFFASAYGLRGRLKKRRIDWAIDQFDLGAMAKLPSEKLPGGYRQRLAMASALLHEPEILFLDEATSGADPMARREFWSRINALARQGVTVVITTHFMEEAEYCDRVAILDAGRIVAQGASTDIRRSARLADAHEATMEDAFITIVTEARRRPEHEAG